MVNLGMVDPVALLTLGSYTTGNIGDYDQTHTCSSETYQSTNVMRWDRFFFNRTIGTSH